MIQTGGIYYSTGLYHNYLCPDTFNYQNNILYICIVNNDVRLASLYRITGYLYFAIQAFIV